LAQHIAIVDYGMGNLRSVYQALKQVAPKAEVLIARTAAEIQHAQRVVLPGQGAMPDCMKHLRISGLLEAVLVAAQTKPLLGICIGEQMLFDFSAESPSPQATPCLGLISGTVERFALTEQLQADGAKFKVPHMGWNQVRQDKPHFLWTGIPDFSNFYFVHSYYAVPSNPEYTVGSTEYGGWFTSAVARDNIFATQFHPEKSAKYGLMLYRNFVAWQP